MAKNDMFSKENLGCYLPHEVTSNPKKTAFVMVKNHYVKVGSKWVLESSTYENVNAEWYANTIGKETLRWFRSLGGYEKNQSAYTDYGYIVIRNISISPSKSEKSVTEFYTPTMWKNSGKFVIQKYKSIKRK